VFFPSQHLSKSKDWKVVNFKKLVINSYSKNKKANSQTTYAYPFTAIAPLIINFRP
jgi:hypothetical protein